MKKVFLIKIFICIFICGKSQNLLPNYSFAGHDTCPYGLGQLRLAIPWFQPNIAMGGPSGGSTDYFNECSSDTTGFAEDVPKNFVGFQFAKSGVAYAGLSGFLGSSQPNSGREYLEIELLNSFIAGKKYCAQFYVSLAERSYFAIDAIGMYFSTDSILYNSPDFLNLPYQPQIENPKGNVIKDSINWIMITGEFTANGGEKFITIGNFCINDSTSVDTVGNSQDLGASYYYIDDVWVYLCDCDTAPPTANFSFTTDILTATFNNFSSSYANYFFWDFGDGKTDTAKNPVHTFDSGGTYFVTLTAWYNGCIDTMVSQISVSVGMDEHSNTDYRLRIFPNPANSEITISAKSGDAIMIYDVTGRKIKTVQINNNNIVLNVYELDNGIYYLGLYSDNFLVATKKLCVAR